MSDQVPPPPGLMDSLGKAFAAFVSIIQTRAKLVAIEFHEEKYRLVDLFVLAGLVLFLGALAAILLTIVLIFLLPETYRVPATGVLGCLSLAGCVFSILKLKARLKKRAFSESIHQLQKDIECLMPPQ